jgi:hypothetical protein
MSESYFCRTGNDVIGGPGFRVQTAGAMTACMDLPLFVIIVSTRALVLAMIKTGGVDHMYVERSYREHVWPGKEKVKTINLKLNVGTCECCQTSKT